jgi:hypothetical protein
MFGGGPPRIPSENCIRLLVSKDGRYQRSFSHYLWNTAPSPNCSKQAHIGPPWRRPYAIPNNYWKGIGKLYISIIFSADGSRTKNATGSGTTAAEKGAQGPPYPQTECSNIVLSPSACHKIDSRPGAAAAAAAFVLKQSSTGSS